MKHGIEIDSQTHEIRAYWHGTLITTLHRLAVEPLDYLRIWERALVETISALGTPEEVLDFVC